MKGLPIKPVIMGGAMGLMMLAMLHMILTGEGEMTGFVLIVFVLAHLAVVLGLLALSFWAARFAPRVEARLPKLHRPSLQHVGLMVGSAVLCAGIIHLIHGGV